MAGASSATRAKLVRIWYEPAKSRSGRITKGRPSKLSSFLRPDASPVGRSHNLGSDDQLVPACASGTSTSIKRLQTDDTWALAFTNRSPANRGFRKGSRALLKIVVSPVRVRASPFLRMPAYGLVLGGRRGLAGPTDRAILDEQLRTCDCATVGDALVAADQVEGTVIQFSDRKLGPRSGRHRYTARSRPGHTWQVRLAAPPGAAREGVRE